jgi:hypothetical protein
MTISNPTPTLRLEQQGDGTNNSTWGDRVNANFARIDRSCAALQLDVTNGNAFLSGSDSGDTSADAQNRYGIIRANGTPTAPRSVSWPIGSPWREYLLLNATPQPVWFVVNGQPGTKIPPGCRLKAVCNGTDIVPTAGAIQSASPGFEFRVGGVLEQWGIGAATGSAGVSTISFFPTFSGIPWDVQITQISVGGAVSAFSVDWSTATLSGVTVHALAGFSFRWRAIGPA